MLGQMAIAFNLERHGPGVTQATSLPFPLPLQRKPKLVWKRKTRNNLAEAKPYPNQLQGALKWQVRGPRAP